jgi:hypothetical protein
LHSIIRCRIPVWQALFGEQALDPPSTPPPLRHERTRVGIEEEVPMRKVIGHWSFWAVVVLLASASAATAGPIVPSCGEQGQGCTFSARIDGQLVVQGRFGLGPDGEVIFGGPVAGSSQNGAVASINNLFGNADPILGFGIGASTPTASGATFAFNFFLPIAIDGPIDATSSVSYSLTSLGSAGAQVGVLGPGKVVVGEEVDSSVGGLPVLNKGVNVGDTFFFLGGPQTMNSPVYTASSSFTGNLAYDLMSVTVLFSLSANSATGMSGFVRQEEDGGGGPGTPIPEPSTLALLGAGLLGVVRGVRKRLR